MLLTVESSPQPLSREFLLLPFLMTRKGDLRTLPDRQPSLLCQTGCGGSHSRNDTSLLLADPRPDPAPRPRDGGEQVGATAGPDGKTWP